MCPTNTDCVAYYLRCFFRLCRSTYGERLQGKESHEGKRSTIGVIASQAFKPRFTPSPFRFYQSYFHTFKALRIGFSHHKNQKAVATFLAKIFRNDAGSFIGGKSLNLISRWWKRGPGGKGVSKQRIMGESCQRSMIPLASSNGGSEQALHASIRYHTSRMM